MAQIENTNGNTSAQAYHTNVVESIVALAKALEGAVSPLQRIYHASFLTNYSFAEGRLRGFAVGGSARWESKAAIGFFGKVGDPRNSPTVINISDVTRPVYDNNFAADLGFHTAQDYRDKIAWCSSSTSTTRSRAAASCLSFTRRAYRIIDPRQFTSPTFTF